MTFGSGLQCARAVVVVASIARAPAAHSATSSPGPTRIGTAKDAVSDTRRRGCPAAPRTAGITLSQPEQWPCEHTT